MNDIKANDAKLSDKSIVSVGLFPVRCLCKKPLGHLWNQYVEALRRFEQPDDILNRLNVKAACCRSAFLTHSDLSEKFLKFELLETNRQDDVQLGEMNDDGDESMGDD